MAKKNVFNYDVNLVPLDIKNDGQASFREKLNSIPYLLYEVETTNDGYKIAINKPGGKRNFGRLSRNDFMVFIVNTDNNELWMISHDEIYTDIVEKGEVSIDETIKIIDALNMVCGGEEPDAVLSKMNLVNPTGISPEVLLKVYKWIWGQEDCNYPNGEGRWLSMNGLLELKKGFLASSNTNN